MSMSFSLSEGNKFHKTSAHQTVVALIEHNRKGLELKFRNVHALIKKNRPISDITWFT
jgi:hypothetical protein